MPDLTIMGRPLSDADITSAANQLGVTEAHVRAVIAVESSGSGFLEPLNDQSPFPKILFEAHVFSRETSGRFDSTNPTISSPQWNRSLYLGGIREYDRLRQAAALDFEAAYRSASWGLFQIMGSNHVAAGYDQLYDFVGVHYVSEGLQLKCGVNFILSNKFEKFLQREDWSGFAKGYNGPGYQQNHYDEKLAEAFARFKQGTTDTAGGVMELQHALNQFGYNLVVDGTMGPLMVAAIRDFQKNKGLTVDGIAGPETRKALGL